MKPSTNRSGIPFSHILLKNPWGPVGVSVLVQRFYRFINPPFTFEVKNFSVRSLRDLSLIFFFLR